MHTEQHNSLCVLQKNSNFLSCPFCLHISINKSLLIYYVPSYSNIEFYSQILKNVDDQQQLAEEFN